MGDEPVTYTCTERNGFFMGKLRNSALALLAISSIGVATAGSSLAAPAHKAMGMDNVTVNITATSVMSRN
jgi:hypothetical protein